MAGMEYTLTGFDDFLERRRVVFVEPLPSPRVCGVCGVVPSRSLLLPCGHVLCLACKRQIVNGEQKCPMDGREFAEGAVVSINFKQSDLEQHHVFCVVGGRECSFAGRLGDLKEHVAGCCNDKPGVFMTTWKFDEIYAGYSAVTKGKKEHVLSTDSGSLAGYELKLDCKIQTQENEDVLLNFVLSLGDGELDNFLEWPFAKKVTVIVWHPRDERKDIRIPL
ncbi:hypothetical protein V5799_007269 [Amblyomma americanum]|uniref:RING-type domain-containing protein n=1 Tax=Amblyomma americanum TaxID=6943 RepID=A0AAQ4DU14_AMBAM